MDAEGPDASPRISDFDVSKDTTHFNATPTLINPGTRGYMAPELELQQPCSPASDVFALGVTMWQSFLPKHAFVLEKEAHTACVPAVEGLLPGLRRALESMLQRDPRKRPSADELLGFELFAHKAETTAATPSRLEAFRASIKLLRSADLAEPDLVPCVIQERALVQQAAEVIWAQHGRLAVQFSVHFEGEEGVDAGALTKSMFNRFLSQACASPLFETVKKSQRALPRASSGGKETPHELFIYRALGAALIRTILEERVVEAPFATALFKHLQGIPCDLSDLEAFDSSQHFNLVHLLGSQQEVNEDYGFEMVGGSGDVTRHNKHLFLKQYVEYHLIGSRRAALDAMKEGFLSMGEQVNRHLRVLTWRDLQVLLTGPSLLEPAMVIERLEFRGFALDSPTPQQLCALLQSMRNDALKTFVSFATSSPSFAVGTDPRATVIKVVAAVNSPALPTASACFSKLVVPDYRSLDVLRAKFAQALELTGDYFGKG